MNFIDTSAYKGNRFWKENLSKTTTEAFTCRSKISITYYLLPITISINILNAIFYVSMRHSYMDMEFICAKV